jgi:hypothetical protein
MLNRSRLESILVLMAGVVVKVIVQFGFMLLDPRLELVLG